MNTHGILNSVALMIWYPRPEKQQWFFLYVVVGRLFLTCYLQMISYYSQRQLINKLSLGWICWNNFVDHPANIEWIQFCMSYIWVYLSQNWVYCPIILKRDHEFGLLIGSTIYWYGWIDYLWMKLGLLLHYSCVNELMCIFGINWYLDLNFVFR